MLSAIGMQAELENVECLDSTVAFIDLVLPGARAHLSNVSKADMLSAWKSMKKSTAQSLYL